MKKWQRIGICLVLAVSLLVLPACKKSQPATQTTGATAEATNPTAVPTSPTTGTTPSTPSTGTTGEPESTGTPGTEEIPIPSQLDIYKETYPNFFDLSTDDGLEVYVWEYSYRCYQCMLLPGQGTPYTQEELVAQAMVHPATIEIVRAIVNDYIDSGAVTKEQVTVQGAKIHPDTVYAYTLDEAYHQDVADLFWSDFPACTFLNATGYLDIDNDGQEEKLTIGRGYTSGNYTFYINVYKQEKLAYSNLFHSPFLHANFGKDATGQTVLYAWTEWRGQPTQLVLGISEGSITITCDNDELWFINWGNYAKK